MEILVSRMDETVPLPAYAKSGDAGYKWFYCTVCTDGFAPCNTIQAIEKELKQWKYRKEAVLFIYAKRYQAPMKHFVQKTIMQLNTHQSFQMTQNCTQQLALFAPKNLQRRSWDERLYATNQE